MKPSPWHYHICDIITMREDVLRISTDLTIRGDPLLKLILFKLFNAIHYQR